MRRGAAGARREQLPHRRRAGGKRAGNARGTLCPPRARGSGIPGGISGRAGPGRALALAPTERSEVAGRARRRHRGLSRASPQQPRTPPPAHAPLPPRMRRHPLPAERACAAREARACRSPHPSQPRGASMNGASWGEATANGVRGRGAPPPRHDGSCSSLRQPSGTSPRRPRLQAPGGRARPRAPPPHGTSAQRCHGRSRAAEVTSSSRWTCSSRRHGRYRARGATAPLGFLRLGAGVRR